MTKGVSVLYIPKMNMLKSGLNHREERKRERVVHRKEGRQLKCGWHTCTCLLFAVAVVMALLVEDQNFEVEE